MMRIYGLLKNIKSTLLKNLLSEHRQVDIQVEASSPLK